MALTKQLAVGRLVRDNGGDYATGKHQIIASLLADNKDSMKSTYETKINQIMDKAKDIPDKRIRLTTTDKTFEVQVLAHNVGATRIVFFAITDPEFGSSFDPAALLEEFKENFLDLHEESAICKKKLNSSSKKMLEELLNKYAESKLSKVQRQVDQVKDVMNDNMERALDNVATIEQMDANAEEMEKHAGQFKKKAVVVKRKEQSKFYKNTAFLVAIVIVILIILIVAIVCGAGGC